MTDLSRPVMLVAGGTGSIGRVIAAEAVDAGWRVALHGSTPGSVDAVIRNISAPAGGLKGFAADITQKGARWSGWSRTWVLGPAVSTQ